MFGGVEGSLERQWKGDHKGCPYEKRVGNGALGTQKHRIEQRNLHSNSRFHVGVGFERMTEPGHQPIQHLYLHVPFCPTICPYCDFHVLTRRAGLVEAYLTELEREAHALANEFPSNLTTVYIGGGTPSFLRDQEIERLVGIVRDAFGWVPDFASGGEATLEINPGTVTPARARLWRELGFDRASVGVQSTQDHVLKFLGRTHNSWQAFQALETLHNTGFRVSADLITAAPDQDVEMDLHALGSFGLEHISAYTLTIEDGTPFARAGVKVLEDDETLALERAEPVLHEYGLERYEISNHARPGRESRHNIAYWQNQFWYGLGPSATGQYAFRRHGSGVRGVITERRKNPPLEAWLRGERATPENGLLECVTPEEFVTDALFAGLRLRSGINLTELSERAGLNVLERYHEPVQKLLARGWLELNGETLRATRAGTWVLNQVVTEFL
jgi:oxygen-independent coproporphyrinogen-3 oxidase